MPLDLPPLPKLWLPAKPAIIRANDLPRSFAEAKKIAHKPDIGTFPFPTFVPKSISTFRYLRMRQTANVGGTDYMILWSLQYSNDGGTTWYPTSNMTGASAPSPLVASADSETGGFPAYYCFDGNAATRFTSGAGSHPHYVTLDLGSGNGILPNRVRFGIFNQGPDYTPKDFTVLGSNTGSFAGEEVTLLTVSGASSGGADGTVVTYTI